jgi:hypothetical protein
MFDTVIVLDPLARLCCPDGHVPHSFQTKDIAAPHLRTYLVHGGKLYRALEEEDAEDSADPGWRIAADVAVQERRCRLREMRSPRSLRIYASCSWCEPVLTRSDAPQSATDIIREYRLFVDYRLTFGVGEPLRMERLSGTRDELGTLLRARGLFVLDDDDPLALAHRTLKAARKRAAERS